MNKNLNSINDWIQVIDDKSPLTIQMGNLNVTH